MSIPPSTAGRGSQRHMHLHQMCSHMAPQTPEWEAAAVSPRALSGSISHSFEVVKLPLAFM